MPVLQIKNLGVQKSSYAHSIFIGSNKSNILIDFGKIKEHNPSYPNLSILPCSLSKIDSVFITHLHYDHFGGLEYLAKIGFKGSIFLGPRSYHILIKWIRRRKKLSSLSSLNLKKIELLNPVRVGDISITGYASNHTFDSVMFLVEQGHLKILVTSDLGDHLDEIIQTLNSLSPLTCLLFDATLSFLKTADKPEVIENEFMQIIGTSLDHGFDIVIPLQTISSVCKVEMVLTAIFQSKIRATIYYHPSLEIFGEHFFGDEICIYPSNSLPNRSTPYVYFAPLWKANNLLETENLERMVFLFSAYGHKDTKMQWDETIARWGAIENIDFYNPVSKVFHIPLSNHLGRTSLKTLISTLTPEIAIPLFKDHHGNLIEFKTWWKSNFTFTELRILEGDQELILEEIR